MSCEEVTFNVTNKITQIGFEKISLPIFDFSDLTERGTGGFGSTNRE